MDRFLWGLVTPMHGVTWFYMEMCTFLSMGSCDPITFVLHNPTEFESMARKPTDTVQLKLRFPESLRRRLEREAKRHGQSLNSEIVSILEGAFRQSDEVQDRAKAIAEALGDEIVNAIVEQANIAAAEDIQADTMREAWEEEQHRQEEERTKEK